MTLCFYLGKPCRYGCDAAPEEQMDCSTCPAFAMWQMVNVKPRQKPDTDTQ